MKSDTRMSLCHSLSRIISSQRDDDQLRAGHSSIIVDNPVNSSAESLHRVECITKSSVPLCLEALPDRDGLERVLEGYAFTACIQFAGFQPWASWLPSPLAYYVYNLNWTFILINLMTKYGYKTITFYFSAAIN